MAAIALALLVLALAGAIVLVAQPRPTGTNPGAGRSAVATNPPAISEETASIAFEAASIMILVDGQSWTLPSDTASAVQVASGSDAATQSLDLGWYEPAGHQELNLTIQAVSGGTWRLAAVTTCDGATPPHAVTYALPDIGAASGRPFTGDVVLRATASSRHQATVTIRGLRLSGFREAGPPGVVPSTASPTASTAPSLPASTALPPATGACVGS